MNDFHAHIYFSRQSRRNISHNKHYPVLEPLFVDAKPDATLFLDAIIFSQAIWALMAMEIK